MNIMCSIARANEKHIPDGVILALDEELKKPTDNEDHEKEAITVSIVDVIKSPLTRLRLFLSVGISFLCSIMYHDLSLNVVNLGTNLHLNVVLYEVAEIQAYLLTALLQDKFGHKPLTVGTLWLSGIFGTIGAVANGDGIWKAVRMVCGILGILGMAGNYNLLFIYVAELFPTVLRNAALGCSTQGAQMGAILTPFAVVMGGWLPFASVGFCGLLGGVLVFWLHETLNQPLYDMMGGMEGAEDKCCPA